MDFFYCYVNLWKYDKLKIVNMDNVMKNNIMGYYKVCIISKTSNLLLTKVCKIIQQSISNIIFGNNAIIGNLKC